METLILKTDAENADFYISSLAIGILEGMKSGDVPLEVGTRSLSRPVFWQELEKSHMVSGRLVDWVSSIDELDIIQEKDGRAFQIIDELLVLLKVSQKKALGKGPSLQISSLLEKSI